MGDDKAYKSFFNKWEVQSTLFCSNKNLPWYICTMKLRKGTSPGSVLILLGHHPGSRSRLHRWQVPEQISGGRGGPQASPGLSRWCLRTPPLFHTPRKPGKGAARPGAASQENRPSVFPRWKKREDWSKGSPYLHTIIANTPNTPDEWAGRPCERMCHTEPTGSKSYEAVVLIISVDSLQRPRLPSHGEKTTNDL